MGVRSSSDALSGKDNASSAHRFDYKCGCIRLPMEIANLLVIYLKERRKREQISDVVLGQVFLMVNALMENVSGFERIFTTPIPVAYSLHLKHTVVLYLLSLPFQLVKDLNWWVIPIMTIASFTLMGVETIGAEIENPFGNDANDLPIESYCRQIKREIAFLLERPVTNPMETDWEFLREDEDHGSDKPIAATVTGVAISVA
ncbi:hypothetical protein HK102_010482 [Quaeritorhiza haematococci]|nr:hypothetical protein HK102_010482 [Quaeritorhiza haematococci]